jgi:hypothetical protein
MNNGEIYEFVTTILRKEKNGSVLDPNRFNLMLKESMWEKVNDEYRKYELSQIISDTLQDLKATSIISIDNNGEFKLNNLLLDDYWHPSALRYDDTGAVTRKIEIVTDLEYTNRLSSVLLQPDETFPIAKFYRNSSYNLVIKFYPLTNNTANFDYLRIPPNPFFDYYINANDEIIYMEPGTDHTLTAGEKYRDGTTVGLVSSISVELPFPEGDRLDVSYMILQKLGIPVKEQLAVEYGAVREGKEDQL